MTTSASTVLPIPSREDIWIGAIDPQIFSEAAASGIMAKYHYGSLHGRAPSSSTASDRELFLQGAPDMGVFSLRASDREEVLPYASDTGVVYLRASDSEETFSDACYQVAVRELSGYTTKPDVTFFVYGGSSGPVVVVDFKEPTSEFPEEQQAVVNRLRENGRPILADRLVTMLRDVEEDPDSPPVNIVSLKQMASLFIDRQEFADPSIGPDSLGVVYAQWRIGGNGILVIRFPDDKTILLVAQADKTSECHELDISEHGPRVTLLKEYGYLVPLRQ